MFDVVREPRDALLHTMIGVLARYSAHVQVVVRDEDGLDEPGPTRPSTGSL